MKYVEWHGADWYMFISSLRRPVPVLTLSKLMENKAAIENLKKEVAELIELIKSRS